MKLADFERYRLEFNQLVVDILATSKEFFPEGSYSVYPSAPSNDGLAPRALGLDVTFRADHDRRTGIIRFRAWPHSWDGQAYEHQIRDILEGWGFGGERTYWDDAEFRYWDLANLKGGLKNGAFHV